VPSEQGESHWKKPARIDSVDKALGRAKYAADMVLPGMLFAKVVRSPYPHANILSVDTTEAEKLPGVKAVVTGIKDTPRGLYSESFPTQETTFSSLTKK